MDFERDILSQLMLMDVGAQKFVAKCLLLLTPEEIKSCRLVCHLWDQFIVDNIWKSTCGKKQLSQKLLQRWKTADPMRIWLTETKEGVESIYCNDAHVFCGLKDNVRVYNLESGELTKELTPIELKPDSSTTQVVGGKGIVATLFRCPSLQSILTIWSSQGQMDQLFYFNFQNYRCPYDCPNTPMIWIRTLQVVGTNKVAILTRHSISDKTSLVVMEKVDSTWDTKTLGCFRVDSQWPSLASDGGWLAVLDASSSNAQNKVKLWGDDGDNQDIVLPGINTFQPAISMFLEIPHLILGVSKDEARNPNIANWIKVYRIEDTVPCLIKSIKLDMGQDSARYLKPIANQFCIGFMEHIRGYTIVHQFMKKELVDAALSPDKTEKREIRVEGRKVSMNSTCLLAAVTWPEKTWMPQRTYTHDLEKNEFWMSKMGLTYRPL